MDSFFFAGLQATSLCKSLQATSLRESLQVFNEFLQDCAIFGKSASNNSLQDVNFFLQICKQRVYSKMCNFCKSLSNKFMRM